jgi:hypothetical protein
MPFISNLPLAAGVSTRSFRKRAVLLPYELQPLQPGSESGAFLVLYFRLISCGELQLAPVPRWGDAGDAAENGSEMLLVATIAKWHEQPKTEIAACLPLAEFLKVWDTELTPHERAQLVGVLLLKKNAYLQQVRALTPTELARDKTYRRLRSMFPAN